MDLSSVKIPRLDERCVSSGVVRSFLFNSCSHLSTPCFATIGKTVPPKRASESRTLDTSVAPQFPTLLLFYPSGVVLGILHLWSIARGHLLFSKKLGLFSPVSRSATRPSSFPKTCPLLYPALPTLCSLNPSD